MTNNNIETQVQLYKQLGYKPVPLIKGGKRPLVAGYLTSPVTALWDTYDCNVGLQCGVNGLICFDADDAITDTYLAMILTPYNPWVVQTRDGKHYWLKTDEHNWAKSFRVMSGRYSGEVRLQNCQTVVPPSYVAASEYKHVDGGGWQYVTIQNDITTMGHIPLMVVEVFIDGLCNSDKIPAKADPISTVSQIELERPDITVNHLAIKCPHIEWTNVPNLVKKVNWLRNARPGDNLTLIDGPLSRTYNSRSEVFQSIVYSLVRYGYSDDAIMQVCKDERLTGEPNFYYKLGLALDKAYSKLISDPVRVNLQNLYYNVNQYKHVNDKLVYEYILARAMQFGTYKVNLNHADLMVHTGIINYQSVRKSVNRLVGLGLIERGEKKVVTVLKVSTVNCVYLPSSVSQNLAENAPLHIDLIAQKILGNAVETFSAILGESEPLSPVAIIKLAGCDKRTGYRHIKKLLDLGLVEKHDTAYIVHPDWQMVLYDLAKAHYTVNKTQIETMLTEWRQRTENQRLYGRLKDIMPQPVALAMIKAYETDGVLTDEIKQVLHGKFAKKPVDRGD